ncbi:MAG: glycosyltransferase family 2 protein [Nitrospinota bacterium]|nr:glycosyltransferase family 2 protein [Nitrospinota bacterium]
MKVTLLVLTLNEIDGMQVIMPRIDPSWCDQILILDGGSTDGTVEWAREQGYQVYIQKQKGFRHAYFEGLPYIEGDTIITFSPDGNTVPEEIPTLIEKMHEGYDMVIGSRYLDDAKSDDDDWLTGFGNWLFTRTVNFLYGGHYTDVMVIFRIYKKSLIHELGLDRDDAYELPEKLFFCKISWEPLMSVRALKKGKKVGEIPADEPERIGGVRKLRIFRWGAAYYFQFWRELWFWRQ